MTKEDTSQEYLEEREQSKHRKLCISYEILKYHAIGYRMFLQEFFDALILRGSIEKQPNNVFLGSLATELSYSAQYLYCRAKFT